ncbi:hypothetical protein KM043_006755 [Ampulex compressa]|nr:hypothetical protein KM043_006755 [Ampulex compressa]
MTRKSVPRLGTLTCHGTRHVTPGLQDSAVQRGESGSGDDPEKGTPPRIRPFCPFPSIHSPLFPFLHVSPSCPRGIGAAASFLVPPLETLSRYFGIVRLARRWPPSGIPYLPLHLSSNWFSGRKGQKDEAENEEKKTMEKRGGCAIGEVRFSGEP